MRQFPLLAWFVCIMSSSLAAADSPLLPAVPLPSDADCWKLLPAVTRETDQPLPNWAKAVATELPRTAAAMLRLDYAQRTQSPLDPLLRAKLRYIVATENHCSYAQAVALADLERAGMPLEAINRLKQTPHSETDPDHETIRFISLLTTNAPGVPEELFKSIQTRYGENKLVAMVLLAAYGNFQDRILLGLNLPLEENGPLPPLDVQFSPTAFQATPVLPAQGKIPEPITGGENLVSKDQEWSELSFDQLQKRLEDQRQKAPLIRIPAWEEVREKLPESMKSRPTRIVWNLAGWYYAPELSVPWSLTTRTMWVEASPDRILEESLFWVQTRAIRCNYCMGHCEMLLEVAGLNDQQIADRTRRLAGNDWSSFPPEEQRAYAYAKKLTRTPSELTPEDYRTLVKDYGAKKAMATFFWLCRGLYMTRVSDGLKLPLERENVFGDYRNNPPKK